jgi:hypothetical protein
MFQHTARFSNGQLVDRYSSRKSPYRYGAWTISSSLCFKEGALRMASEDSLLFSSLEFVNTKVEASVSS